MQSACFHKQRTLSEKCPNTEFFLVRIFLYSNWIQEITEQKKLRIWTFFMQWHKYSSNTEKFYFSFVKVIPIQTATSLLIKENGANFQFCLFGNYLWGKWITFLGFFYKMATFLCYLSRLKNVRCTQNMSRNLENIFY